LLRRSGREFGSEDPETGAPPPPPPPSPVPGTRKKGRKKKKRKERKKRTERRERERERERAGGREGEERRGRSAAAISRPSIALVNLFPSRFGVCHVSPIQINTSGPDNGPALSGGSLCFRARGLGLCVSPRA